jgi:hypothetical protein
LRDSSKRAAKDSDIEFPNPQNSVPTAPLLSFLELTAAVWCGF